MIAYDFDNTIFSGDCSVGFFKYCLSKRPLLVMFYLIRSIPTLLLFVLKLRSKIQAKDKLFAFIPKLNNIVELVEDYWDINENRIKEWYKNQYNENDVIISASYDFIIKPICNRLNLKNVISTDYHLKKGKTVSLHCYGSNKIIMFNDQYPKKKIKVAYSDSKSDIPLLEYATIGYVVKDEQVIPYEKGIFKKI